MTILSIVVSSMCILEVLSRWSSVVRTCVDVVDGFAIVL